MKRFMQLLGVFYLLMGGINLWLSLTNIELYGVWKNSAFLVLYRVVFSLPESTLLLCILTVALFEMILGSILLFSQIIRRGALYVAITFHVLLLPLGWWSMLNIVFIILYCCVLKSIKPTDLRAGITRFE
ncbi:hypothetical protein EJF36_09920 [Bacillus sp. HMF5848]|uniref:hypothetical protein n=1 Tax=Bacillus sp. HMF5848 TaxID=2495421 RepID=UPI000F797ED1|nr:hypothetical protein [Bacillus sp. HMF5848]RSK27169.1 hypothetical protein EJF36_09920 [Bacillus sp. HMF5848]